MEDSSKLLPEKSNLYKLTQDKIKTVTYKDIIDNNIEIIEDKNVEMEDIEVERKLNEILVKNSVNKQPGEGKDVEILDINEDKTEEDNENEDNEDVGNEINGSNKKEAHKKGI